MSVPQDLADYCEAEFPLDIPNGSSGGWRLFARIQGRVYGVHWYGDSLETAWSISERSWSGAGIWLEGERGAAHMDLPPPPARVAVRVAEIEAEIAEIRARLAAHPDAPDAWRMPDENRIRAFERRIAGLRGQGE